MTKHDQGSHVLVAGAGIGGLAAALGLSRAGARVTVIERARELSEIGAGLQLSPNATRVLRRFGVLEAVASVAAQPSGVRVRDAPSGRTLSFMALNDAERRWGAPYLVIRRADLQRVLAEAVAADNGITLQLGTALAGFGTTERGVRATVKQGLIGRVLEADMLIGADGIRSTVRSRLAGEPADAPQETGRTAWRATIESAALDAVLRSDETNLWVGPDAHLVHYPISSGRLVNIVAITRDPSCERTEGSDPSLAWAQPGDATLVTARFRHWHASVRTLIAAAPIWTTWPLYDRAPLAAWNAGPVALLGDAAHPTLPFLAQGAAQAVEDAAALADAYAATRSTVDALAAYSRARVARARRVQEAARQLGRIYHLAGPAAVARNAVMKLAGGKRLLARYDWLYGL